MPDALPAATLPISGLGSEYAEARLQNSKIIYGS